VARALRPQGRRTPGRLIIHETATGAVLRGVPLPEVMGNYSGDFTWLTFSGDGTRLALASRTRRRPGRPGAEDPLAEVHALVWSVADGRELLHDSWTVPAASNGAAVGALARDGARMALATHENDSDNAAAPRYYGELRVLDVADGRERIHLTSESEGYTNPDLSPDGRLVAASVMSYRGGVRGSQTTRLVLQEVESGRARTDLEEPALPSTNCSFSPDGRCLAVATLDPGRGTSLVVCDLEAGRRVATEPLPRAIGFGPGLYFSPDSRLLIVAAADGSPECQVREVPGGRLLRTLSLGATASYDLAIRPSDGHLITVDSACNIREWPSPTPQPAALDSGRLIEKAGRVALVAGGRALIGLHPPGGPDEPTSAAVYDVDAGQVLRRFEREGPGTPSSSLRTSKIAIGSLGSRFALPAVTRDRGATEQIEVWDSATGQHVVSLDSVTLGGDLNNPTYFNPNIALDARGTRLAVVLRIAEPRPDGKGNNSRALAVSIVELPAGRLLRKISLARPLPVYQVALSPDGRVVAVSTIEFAPTGEQRNSIDLRDADSGRILQTLHSSLFRVLNLAFSADGLQLAAMGDESTGSHPIEVWNLAPGAPPDPLHLDGHGSMAGVGDLAFSADGRRLATIAARGYTTDGELKLWDTTSGRDLVTWALPGRPLALAFDGGDRLRVLLQSYGASDARVVLFDAAPVAPELEAIDLVDRLSPNVPLNSELTDRIKAESGLDAAVRAAALALVPLRQEVWSRLARAARMWLSDNPELTQRALVYMERAFALAPDMDSSAQAALGEARYRNGKFAECLEPLRRSLALANEEDLPAASRTPRPLAFIAMAEAKLGHRDLAQAALDEYRTRRSRESAGAMAPPEEKIDAEVETVFREAFGGTPAAVAPASK
jgi:WD40 repeat protein